MDIKVKICGIKSYKDAKICVAAGVDFLGFNFVPASIRFITPKAAKKIIDVLPQIKKVGVFIDAEIQEVNNLISDLKLNYIQLHGNESPKYIDSIKNAGIIKTFSLPFDFDVEKTIRRMRKYKVDYFLLDRKEQGKGELLDPDKVSKLTAIFPVILAGGLTVENVAHIVQKTRPQIVDVAGGIETNGIKDKEKIIKFIKSTKLYV